MAAATENYYDRKNDSPGAVIVEKMAKTVVHKVCSSGCLLWRLPSLIFIVCTITLACYGILKIFLVLRIKENPDYPN